MSDKPLPKPAWYKNTYFWIAGALFVLGVVGLIGGDATIRDPGQKKEGGLWIMYVISAVVMFVNGWLSHRQTVLHYNEQEEAPK